MKKSVKILPAILLTAALGACSVPPETVPQPVELPPKVIDVQKDQVSSTEYVVPEDYAKPVVSPGDVSTGQDYKPAPTAVTTTNYVTKETVEKTVLKPVKKK